MHDHLGSYAIGWNGTLKELGFGNSGKVIGITGGYPYTYETFVPTYPRYMERKLSSADQLYINVPGLSYPPIYNRPNMKMITNITSISEIARENIGAMIDNDYNVPYGAVDSPPYHKFYLTGNQFNPIYRAIPSEDRVTGEPSVPEFDILFLFSLIPVVYFAKRRRVS